MEKMLNWIFFSFFCKYLKGVSITTFTGNWTRQSDNITFECHTISNATLDCTFSLLEREKLVFDKHTFRITFKNNPSKQGTYHLNKSVTWNDGEEWMKGTQIDILSLPNCFIIIVFENLVFKKISLV